MRFRTKLGVLDGVADRYRRRYYENFPERRSIHARLEALPKATKENEAYLEREIDSLVGNKSWTILECGVCEREVKETVIFPTPEDCELLVCKDCLEKAARLMR